MDANADMNLNVGTPILGNFMITNSAVVLGSKNIEVEWKSNVTPIFERTLSGAYQSIQQMVSLISFGAVLLTSSSLFV